VATPCDANSSHRDVNGASCQLWEGLLKEVRKAVENGKKRVETFLTAKAYLGILTGLWLAFLLDRGAYRSLTTDTMCQNLFETIRVFERGWIE
jgi:hypothetical protein